MSWTDFNVEEIEEVHIECKGSLVGRDLMSPYVWKGPDGRLEILLRGVPPGDQGVRETGSIYHGTGENGSSFVMKGSPVIAPDADPKALDHGGCEDPTVLRWNDEYIVYYTGVEGTLSKGVMLHARGPSMDRLTKRGIAHASSKTEGNVKEATVARTPDGRWRLFYEYAHDRASRIGLALGAGIVGPWEERDAPFAPRPGRWDNWHLSTGPMLHSDPDRPIMFYNGATRDARWRIGWIMFDRDCTRALDRCIQPLLTPPPSEERSGTDIAFAASLIEQSAELCHLYYSVDDRSIFRALVRRS
jgi:predicted GH43/DUF377 family glycosyl hydrolase